MWFIDGHLDLAWNAVELGRDERMTIEQIRLREGMHPTHGEGAATVSLPALRAADVRLIFGTIFTYPDGTSSSQRPGYHTPDEAFQRGAAQLAYYHQLAAAGDATLVRTRTDLEALITQERPLPGILPLMEGADPIRTPEELEWFVARGVRIIGLSWKATRYAGGVGMPGPLTAEGRDLLREMAALDVVLDVSHLAEEAFWQALEVFEGRVIASHANCRALVPTARQLSDEMIRAIADRDGVIGLVLYNAFLQHGWQSADGKGAVSLAHLVRQVEHLAHLVGIRHIALGSDLDGGVSRDDIPRELDSVLDFPRIASALADNYEPTAVEAIMHGNWLRLLRALFPA